MRLVRIFVIFFIWEVGFSSSISALTLYVSRDGSNGDGRSWSSAFNELNQIQTRHAIGIGIFDDWSKIAPAFGMIGTLIGLITMLAQIEDKSAIGIGMSTALMTTLYGATMAYLVFLPVKRKLEDRDNSESLVKEIMIEGILSIQSGDNPRILEEKLLAFLPPLRREAVRQEAVRE